MSADPVGVAAGRSGRTRAARKVLAALALAGIAVGALWAVLAPPVRGVVALTRTGERVHAYLGAESDNFFLAAFLMVGLWTVVAVVAAVAVWQCRAHRGPVLAGALIGGAGLGTLISTGVGTALMHWRFGTVDVAGAPVSPEHRVHYVVQAPSAFFGYGPLQLAVTVLLPAATAALVYALFVVAVERDDLGAEPAAPAPPVAAPTPAEIRVDDAGPAGRSAPGH